MFWLAFIFAFVTTISADAENYTDSFSKEILKHFESVTYSDIIRAWEGHKQAMENSIALTMQETMGSPGLNVFPSKPILLRLADAYYQNHGQVHIVFSDINLMDLPKCWLPKVTFLLASNVLRFEAPLTKMIINADYDALRNVTNIVTNINQQDYFKISPFLFHQVPNQGEVAFSVDGCVLSGYVMTMLKGESISLGHEKFSLNKCRYTMEIYINGSGQPPVISEFSDTKPMRGIEIKDLLLRPIKEDFLIKLQAALFSIVNTTAIFGDNLSFIREVLENMNKKCAHRLNKIIRGLNEKVMKINNDVANIEDFIVSWDHVAPYNSLPQRKQLSNMVLTGLGTAYNFHSGGPYKIDTDIKIGEKIGFSSLQVRGSLILMPEKNYKFEFSVEINDFAVNVDIDVEDMGKYTEGELAGFRNIDFNLPRFHSELSSSLITGHLMNVVPQIVIKAMTIDLDPKLMHSEEDIQSKTKGSKTSTPKPEISDDSGDEFRIIGPRRSLKNNASIFKGSGVMTHMNEPDSFTLNNEFFKV